jgi:hypothetical protein
MLKKYFTRNLWATVLALSLFFFGTMVLSHVPSCLKADEDVLFERVANMTSVESNSNNAVEVNGIRFETVMSERVLQIPLVFLG